MGKRHLTVHDIQLIRDFLSDSGIRAVDIQIEFLDHYAILIEKEINIDQTLDFKQALSIAHKKAGGKHQLRKLEKARRKSIDQYWSRRIRTFMKSYFEWPKIIIFLGISVFFFLITYDPNSLYNQRSLFTGIAFTFLSSMAFVFIVNRRLKQHHYYDDDPLYTYQSFRQRLLILSAINMCLFVQLWSICYQWFPKNEMPANILLIIMSCLSAYELLLAHAFETKFQFWIKREIKIKYPEHSDLIKI